MKLCLTKLFNNRRMYWLLLVFNAKPAKIFFILLRIFFVRKGVNSAKKVDFSREFYPMFDKIFLFNEY